MMTIICLLDLGLEMNYTKEFFLKAKITKKKHD